MSIINLLKKYKKRKNPVVFKKNIKLNIFLTKNSIRVYNGKELKKVELNIECGNSSKVGTLIQTRYFHQKDKKIKKKKKK